MIKNDVLEGLEIEAAALHDMEPEDFLNRLMFLKTQQAELLGRSWFCVINLRARWGIRTVLRGIARLLLPWAGFLITWLPFSRKRSLFLDRLIYTAGK